MKKIWIFLVIFGILAGMIAPGVRAEPSQSRAATQGCATLDAMVPLGGSEKMELTADAILLYELNTDTMVYGWNMDGRIDPTGMVKLLTVLVALDYGGLDETVTVKRSTLNSVAIGSVSANLQAGEELSLKDLLYCIMVASANDAAAVVAEHIAGSQAAFVEMMNEKAQALGCTASSFANVHGLSGVEQYTTARDLARITVAGLENPLFAEMFCAEEYTVPATNKSAERRLITTNYMMSDTYTGKYLDSRMTGGKTAAASLTDRSLISISQQGDCLYLCVLMSAEAVVSEDGFVVQYYGSFEETRTVLDYGFRNFSVRQIVDENQTFSQYYVTDGANDVTVRAERDIITLLPADFDPDDLIFQAVVEAQLLQAPIEKDAVLGSLEIRYGNVVLGSCDLLAMYSVAERGSVIQNAPLLEAEEDEGFDFRGLLIGLGIGVLVLLAVAAVVVLSIRLINSARIRRQHRLRMRNRRRSR